MSKVKDKKRKLQEDEGSSSDEGVIDPTPSKTARTEEGSSSVKKVKNSDGDEMMSIGKMRYVTVREFKGRKMVDIREYYEDKSSGKLKPGKKGISMSVEQFAQFKSLLPEIDNQLSA